MNILILATMAPLCGFYLYALVNFQRELRRTKRQEVPGAKTIPLCWRAGQLSAADPAISPAAVPIEPEVAPEARVAGRQIGASVERESFEKIYQFESVYLGPFLLIPMRNSKRKESQRHVTPITSVGV